MIGRIAVTTDKFRGVARETILEMPFLRAGVPPDGKPRHLRRAARALKKAGVRRVVVPAGFEGWAVLDRYGLQSVEPGDFCRAAAAPLALAALRGGGTEPLLATVVLAGERVTRAMRMAALSLCPQVRSLLIDAPTGGAALQAELRREYGVPALEHRPGRRADLTVCFTRPAGAEGAVLDLAGPWPRLENYSVWAEQKGLPEDADPLSLLAALWETGRVQPGQIGARVLTE